MNTNMESFRQLGLSEQILKVIAEEKFEAPSEIQEKSIPLILSGKDVIAASSTGSGKTLAFGSGIIQGVERGRGVRALIITPTRELAEQVGGAIKKFSRYDPLNVAIIYGGMGMDAQLRNLRRADIVAGTPGRLMDHIRRGSLKLGNIRTLVLDEADMMLDMGFIDDIKKIISECPSDRQTLLFSATISDDIKKLAQNHMRNPLEVSAVTQVDPAKLTQTYYDISDGMKFSLLLHMLKSEPSELAMVFCNTKSCTDNVAKNLARSGIGASAIHGGYSQSQRNRTLSQFHSRKAQVLVCTDVAARGLDIKGVSHVYNYDLPRESKQYIHRIGRTARAGNDGKAISILSPRDHGNFDSIIRYQKVKIARGITPQISRVDMSKNVGNGAFGDVPESNYGGNYGGRDYASPSPAQQQGRFGSDGNRSDRSRQGRTGGPRRSFAGHSSRTGGYRGRGAGRPANN